MCVHTCTFYVLKKQRGKDKWNRQSLGEGGNVNVKNMETEVTFSYTKQALSFMV